METRLRFLIVLAVALVPSTASANAGTPLMWATMLHLFLGNAVIGLVEGILLERLFNCGVRRSILILIAANYVSAWVGYGLVSGGLGMLPEITIETVRFWSWVFFAITFVVTLLIELPFVRWVMPPQGKTFGQVLKGAFGKVTSLASDSDWEFRTGFWAAEGIKGTNKKTGDKVHYALETPYSMWNVRNATQIEGDMVVFQLGKSQICALHPESRRIALLARGKGPIVAKRGAAN
jgi:hypothetical protein